MGRVASGAPRGGGLVLSVRLLALGRLLVLGVDLLLALLDPVLLGSNHVYSTNISKLPNFVRA